MNFDCSLFQENAIKHKTSPFWFPLFFTPLEINFYQTRGNRKMNLPKDAFEVKIFFLVTKTVSIQALNILW